MNPPDLSGLSNIQIWAFMLFNITSIIWTLLKLNSTQKNTQQTVDNTVPVGNGFTKHVLEKLDNLTASSEIIQRSVDGLQEKTDEQRSQLDFLNDRVIAIDKRQQDHMEYHMNRENPHA